MLPFIRADDRQYDEIRPLKAEYNTFGYSDGSVLFEIGKTKVLCSVTIENNVPSFLKAKGTGWLSAEYALLPTATHQRNSRESSSFKRNNRSIEISRLIGRSLRSIISLDKLGEKTINIDCDVLQADGGTRTACITGSFFALKAAQDNWLNKNIIKQAIITDEIASISVGLIKGNAILDIDYLEDNITEMDFNFVFTRSGKIVEIQGTAEKNPVTWQEFENVRIVAQKGIDQIFSYFDKNKKNN